MAENRSVPIQGTPFWNERVEQQEMSLKKRSYAIETTSQPTSNKRKRWDFLGQLLPTPQSLACKPCNPSEGLAIGGRSITIEELNTLTPDDLGEHAITRNGEELTMEQLVELLDMPAEFADMVASFEGDDVDMGLPVEDAMESDVTPAGTTASPLQYMDEQTILAFSNQFR